MLSLEQLELIDPNGPRTLEEMVRRKKERQARYYEIAQAVRKSRPKQIPPIYDMASVSKQMQQAHIILDDYLGVTIDRIQRAVASFYNISVAEIKSPRRQANLILPRQIAMYLAKELIPSKSLPQIAKVFGNRDHTTVLSNIRKIQGLIDNGDTILIAEIAGIRLCLGEMIEDKNRIANSS